MDKVGSLVSPMVLRGCFSCKIFANIFTGQLQSLFCFVTWCKIKLILYPINLNTAWSEYWGHQIIQCFQACLFLCVAYVQYLWTVCIWFCVLVSHHQICFLLHLSLSTISCLLSDSNSTQISRLYLNDAVWIISVKDHMLTLHNCHTNV